MLVLCKQISSTTQLCSNLTIIGSLISWEGVEKHYFPKEIMTDEREVIVLYTINELEPCQTYTAVIMISTSLVEKADNFTFGKFILLLNNFFYLATPSTEIQNVILSSEEYTNGSVSVQCVFVSGSTADGCHVIFTDTTNGGRYESFNITGSNKSLISLSTSGNYTVTVYGIINRNIIKWSCLQPIMISIVFIPQIMSPNGKKITITI